MGVLDRKVVRHGLAGLALACWQGCGPERDSMENGSTTTGTSTEEGSTSQDAATEARMPEDTGTQELEPPDPCVEVDIEACEEPCWRQEITDLDLYCVSNPVCLGPSSTCEVDEDCRAWQTCESILVPECWTCGFDACLSSEEYLCWPLTSEEEDPES
jgi:hypothetical protein